jgi:hypothetical protein
VDLHDALTQITEIRQQLARTEVFRGYRAMPITFSGVLALAVAGFQALWLPQPAGHEGDYLLLWIGAALVSMVVLGIGLVLDYRQNRSPLTRSTTLLAVGQFLPSVIAGGLVVFVLWNHAQDGLWMLPGLWAILFGLGIFASYRLLPRAIFWVGVYYLVTGSFCLAWAQKEYAFSPLAMAVPFGIGQLLAAGVLYWTLERTHVEK